MYKWRHLSLFKRKSVDNYVDNVIDNSFFAKFKYLGVLKNL